MAGSVMAAEPQTPADAAKSQSMGATTQTKLAATDRAAAATRTSAPAADKAAKARPAYCSFPQQRYYYDQTPGELSDCQK